MICRQCGKETDEGKFCMHCGAPLHEDETAGTEEINPETQPAAESPSAVDKDGTSHNDTVEKLQTTGKNFGQFFTKLVKKPTEAVQTTSQDMVSGVLSISLYALLSALGSFILLKKLSGLMGGFGSYFGMGSMSVPFTDGFLLPLIKYLILFAIAIGLTFAILKLVGSDMTIKTVVAKYGAYLLPFTLALILGTVLMLIGIFSLGILMTVISFMGILFLVPTFIITEVPDTNFDRIYGLFFVYAGNLIVFWYIMKSTGLSGMGGMF